MSCLPRRLVYAAPLLAAPLWYYQSGIRQASACGIMAFVGKDDNAIDFLLEGVTILQNRGYDSAGVATLDKENHLFVSKYASVENSSDCIAILKRNAPEKHNSHTIGIAHTRWATHGPKTDANAHPHCDDKNRIALVHNGTIENAAILKEELLAKRYKFASQTDTEIIANLIGMYLDEGMELDDAFARALSRMEGTWGICMISKDDPGKIRVARLGSPIIIGIGNDHMFVASEHTAFNRHTSSFIELKDGEIATVTANGVNLDISRKQEAPKEDILLTPDPFPYWTIREIKEQPEALARSLNFGGRFLSDSQVLLGGLDSNKDTLLPIKNLVISACGTSLYASEYGARLMRWLGSFKSVHPIDAAEIEANSFPTPLHETGILAVSQSGETADVIDALDQADLLGVPKFSIVNCVGSSIARRTGCGVYLKAGREFAVASTKAFTTSVSVLALVASWFSQHGVDSEVYFERRKLLIDSLHRLPIYVGMVLNDNPNIKAIAERIKDKKHMFVLGKGFGEPIAYEAALKIKEITYIHAEGYSGGALKHGPFALIEKGTPIIMMIFDDEHAGLMKTAAEEVRARGAHTIIITDNPKLAQHLADDLIYVPSNGPLTALLGIVPIQLLAYELALLKGINPDMPKNLAKAITVR